MSKVKRVAAAGIAIVVGCITATTGWAEPPEKAPKGGQARMHQGAHGGMHAGMREQMRAHRAALKSKN